MAATYFGVVIAPTGAQGFEVEARLKKARQRHAMLTPRLWRSCAILLALKIKLWRALVLSCSVYGLDVATHNQIQMAKLERWHLNRSAAHVKHTNNRQVREICGTHSLDSILRLRRLRCWRGVLKNDDTTMRTIWVVEWSFEEADTARPMESDRAKLYCSGISKLCCEVFQRQRQTPQRRKYRTRDWRRCSAWKALMVEECMWNQQRLCQVCGNVFHGVRGLQIHMFKKAQ